MKNASTILSHLSNQPQFKVLKQERCYKKYIALLGAKWQKAVAFVYIKNDTLFVAVTHPGFKMELNYNRDLLKSLLTQMASLDAGCKTMKADKVVVFHSKYRSIIKEETDVTTVPYYHEASSADFDLKGVSETLQEKFKEIQQSIRKQLQKQEN